MNTRRSTAEFLGSVNRNVFRRSTFLKLTEVGMTIGWIHPKIGIAEKNQHGLIPVVVEETSDNKRVVKTTVRGYNCSGEGCPMCMLIAFAEMKIRAGVDPDATILNGDKYGNHTLNTISGRASSWKTNISAKNSYIIPWISSEKRSDASPVVILNAPVSLGKAISDCIVKQQEYYGEVDGDPMRNPYAFRLEYKESESPAHKYQASVVPPGVVSIDDEVRAIMAADETELGIDLDQYCKPDEPEKVMAGISSSWVSRQVSFAEFAEFVGVPKTMNARDVARCSEEVASGRTFESEGYECEPNNCIACGMSTHGSKFCPHCGVKQDADVSHRRAQPTFESRHSTAVQQPQTQTILCPHCGVETKVIKSKRCLNCGKLTDIPI